MRSRYPTVRSSEDIIEQLKMGAPIGRNTDAERLGKYVPDIAVMNAPYFVDSLDEVQRLNESPVQKWLKQLEEEHGIKVLSFKIAHAILFACCDEAAFMTGSVIAIDGGMAM